MYELLGISLVLAALLTINAAASLAAAGLWRLIERPMRSSSARTRAEVLCAMRVGPPAVAFISVALFLVPSYVVYEPYSSGEVVSKKLAIPAILSAIGVAFALWRALRSWLATRSLRRKWLANAVQIRIGGISIPTFLIANSFPIVAVIGTLRPRLFIAKHVLEILNEEELTAAIAHEDGHLSAHDNFKRSLLRVCCDVLMIVPCGRSLDRAWAEAAECAADEQAARRDSETALNLACALVKIAKIVPVGAHAAVPIAAFLVGVEETRGVKARVRRLLEIASDGCLRNVPNPTVARILPAASLGLLFSFAVVLAVNPGVLVTVHSMVERVVKLLS